MKFRDYLNEKGFEEYPKGWTRESIVKFAKSLVDEYDLEGATDRGFFDACVEKMEGNIDNPEGFCASVKSEVHGSTFWRGKGKTEKEAEKAAKEHPNVPKKGKGK